MAQTGEKYTEARRALLGSGGEDGRDDGDPDTTFTWHANSLGWFTGQAYNLILLAEDEARMLSHPSVEPEHLLLATARRGNVERLLGGAAGRVIYDAIVRINGFGERLELRPRRSLASEKALRRAVTAAAARGVRGPSTEHLLLGVAEQDLPARILTEIGVPDAAALVDACYPVTGPPIDPAIVRRRAAALAEVGIPPPSPGPIPPIFERFTSQARDAINAGIEFARQLDDPYVEPLHLLLGALNATGTVGTVGTRFGWDIPRGLPASILADLAIQDAALLGAIDAVTRPRSSLPIPSPQYPDRRATGIFTTDARRIVAEDILIIAQRLEHRELTTGHLLIALLESPDKRAKQIISRLPDAREITAAVIDALPGEENT
jgi:ATP-dependent Clp protease ATP-binding subunit ClpA